MFKVQNEMPLKNSVTIWLYVNDMCWNAVVFLKSDTAAEKDQEIFSWIAILIWLGLNDVIVSCFGLQSIQ